MKKMKDPPHHNHGTMVMNQPSFPTGVKATIGRITEASCEVMDAFGRTPLEVNMA